MFQESINQERIYVWIGNFIIKTFTDKKKFSNFLAFSIFSWNPQIYFTARDLPRLPVLIYIYPINPRDLHLYMQMFFKITRLTSYLVPSLLIQLSFHQFNTLLTFSFLFNTLCTKNMVIHQLYIEYTQYITDWVYTIYNWLSIHTHTRARACAYIYI